MESLYSITPPPSASSSCYSRVVHEVVDFPHGDASYVDEEDQSQQHQVVLRRHPQHELQVEGVQLRQEELGTVDMEGSLRQLGSTENEL